MYIAVDDTSHQEKIEGWRYTNQDGDLESVVIVDGNIEIEDSLMERTSIYYSDIPKLIKALQAAFTGVRRTTFE